jgi:hypothetical protein
MSETCFYIISSNDRPLSYRYIFQSELRRKHDEISKVNASIFFVISPINVETLPGYARGLRGANQSAPHVLTPTVKFGSHFLPQPSDAVKLFSLFSF